MEFSERQRERERERERERMGASCCFISVGSYLSLSGSTDFSQELDYTRPLRLKLDQRSNHWWPH